MNWKMLTVSPLLGVLMACVPAPIKKPQLGNATEFGHIPINVAHSPWKGASKGEIIQQIKDGVPIHYWREASDGFHSGVMEYYANVERVYGKKMTMGVIKLHVANLKEFTVASNNFNDSVKEMSSFVKGLSEIELIPIVREVNAMWNALDKYFPVFESDWGQFEKLSMPFIKGYDDYLAQKNREKKGYGFAPYKDNLPFYLKDSN